MSYKLPTTIWKQYNYSDRLGDIVGSFGVDLSSNYGGLGISERMIKATDSDLLPNTSYRGLNVISAFANFYTADALTDKAYIFGVGGKDAGGSLFYSNGGCNGEWKAYDVTGIGTEPGGLSSVSSDFSDLVKFNASLWSSGKTSLKRFNSTYYWDEIYSGLSSSSIHPMTVLESAQRLYIIDGTSVISVNTSEAVSTSGAYTLSNIVDGVSERISWIKSNSEYIFIGTISAFGDQSRIIVWDGVTENVITKSILIDASGTLSCDMQNDVPFTLDTKGRLLKYNGGAFLEVDKLPFKNTLPHNKIGSSYNLPTESLCHFNGLKCVGNSVFMLLNTRKWDTYETTQENIPSGIWEYREETGLYCRYPINLMTSSESGTDNGQVRISRVGALGIIGQTTKGSSSDFPAGGTNGTLLASVEYYTDATTVKQGIFYNDTDNTLEKSGWFITRKFFSDSKDTQGDYSLIENFKYLSSQFDKLNGDNAKITVKYRTDETNLETDVTWNADNKFTTVFNTDDYEIGDEVYISQGDYAGYYSTISFIEGGLITVADSFTGLSGQTGRVRMSKWKTSGIYTDSEDYHTFSIDKKSSWIQFKVFVTVTGEWYLNNLIVSSLPHQKTN